MKTGKALTAAGMSGAGLAYTGIQLVLTLGIELPIWTIKALTGVCMVNVGCGVILALLGLAIHRFESPHWLLESMKRKLELTE